MIGRVEASSQGSDSRFVITNLAGTPRWLYESVYCARGQAENLIKAQLLLPFSNWIFWTSATAQSVPPADPHRRLLAPAQRCAAWRRRPRSGRAAQFDTIRLALIKVAARVVDMANRIKAALPSRNPHQTSWARLAARATALPP